MSYMPVSPSVETQNTRDVSTWATRLSPRLWETHNTRDVSTGATCLSPHLWETQNTRDVSIWTTCMSPRLWETQNTRDVSTWATRLSPGNPKHSWCLYRSYTPISGKPKTLVMSLHELHAYLRETQNTRDVSTGATCLSLQSSFFNHYIIKYVLYSGDYIKEMSWACSTHCGEYKHTKGSGGKTQSKEIACKTKI